MQTNEKITVSIPVPSQWGIHATISGRPFISGTFIINSITDNKVSGTINFRGIPIPINGDWDETSKQIHFDSPYAAFIGLLTVFDDASISIRHLVFRGLLRMNPHSLHAGESGSWIATTQTNLTGPPIKSDLLPPVGVFLTSNFLHGNGSRF
ncbi:hypothetical protein [Heyndrickxia acidicola]|uniref:Uncharacterized protein n=1 Tax=Heyndrickxia acidicola TaxID=209389 RepID=A0ABU6MF19_9BACI|nr:hypothetical protein [Heyndrickxia acidicola]MED1203261.1 hypothetical protein [Heyndrickxia acidicola]